MRVGDEDRQLSAKEIERLILQKNKDKMRWDVEICVKAKLKDIGEQKIKQFLQEAGLEFHSIKAALEKLGLLKENKLTNAAVILFGKQPQDFFPNAKLRCAVFGGVDTSIITDMHDYDGDLFYLIGKAQEYILDHINIGMKLEGLKRIDVPEIDKEAFREAIINAFCHRDYWDYDSVNVAIFRNRVEIRNPGGLYGNLTFEKIRKEMVSKRRNELIATMFHRVHFIEKWGKGIRLILSKEPETQFKEVADLFITVFKRKEVGTTPKTTLKTTPKTEEQIMTILRQNPTLTKEELAREVGLTIDGIKYHIKRLKKEGKIKWEGPTKGGHWEIT